MFDVKKKTVKRRDGAAESKYRATKVGNSLWTNKTKLKGHSKINDQCCERGYILIEITSTLETKFYLVRYSVRL